MRRRQIIDAAEKVFAAKGFSGATIENIAEQAELSPATLYLYFKNKDELYASLNLKFLKVFIERIEDIRSQNELDPEEKVKALERVLYELYDYDPLNVINVLRFQSSEALRNLSPQLSSQIKDGARQYLRAIAGIFQDGVQAGIFSEHNPIAFADIVWGLYAGLVLWEHTKKGFDSEKDFLKPTLGLAIEIITRGIKKN